MCYYSVRIAIQIYKYIMLKKVCMTHYSMESVNKDSLFVQLMGNLSVDVDKNISDNLRLRCICTNFKLIILLLSGI